VITANTIVMIAKKGFIYIYRENYYEKEGRGITQGLWWPQKRPHHNDAC